MGGACAAHDRRTLHTASSGHTGALEPSARLTMSGSLLLALAAGAIQTMRIESSTQDTNKVVSIFQGLQLAQGWPQGLRANCAFTPRTNELTGQRSHASAGRRPGVAQASGSQLKEAAALQRTDSCR